MKVTLGLVALLLCSCASWVSSHNSSHGDETSVSAKSQTEEDAADAENTQREISPARFYGDAVSVVLEDDELALWNMVQSVLGNSCALDGLLSLAARKHASDVLQQPEVVAENGIDYLRFALRLHGSVDYLISPLVFEPNDEGRAALLRLLGTSQGQWTHCGIGVQEQQGMKKAVFIAATRTMNLNSIPVQPKVGSTIAVNGSLVGGGNSDVSAYLEFPDGHVRELKSYILGKKRFSVSVPLKDAGKYKLELLVTRESGPETATLLPLYVGVPIETRPSVFPGGQTSDESPKETMTRMINRIRRNMGMPELVRDARLDEVAQSHCRDMATADYFGHFSVSSGMLADRLKAKQLFPRMIAENIAQSASLMRVHHNLMQSPSHKIKLLTPEYTHLGLGAVEREGVIVVTQVFATW